MTQKRNWTPSKRDSQLDMIEDELPASEWEEFQNCPASQVRAMMSGSRPGYSSSEYRTASNGVEWPDGESMKLDLLGEETGDHLTPTPSPGEINFRMFRKVLLHLIQSARLNSSLDTGTTQSLNQILHFKQTHMGKANIPFRKATSPQMQHFLRLNSGSHRPDHLLAGQIITGAKRTGLQSQTFMLVERQWGTHKPLRSKVVHRRMYTRHLVAQDTLFLIPHLPHLPLLLILSHRSPLLPISFACPWRI